MIIKANPFVRIFGESLYGLLWFSTYSSCEGRRLLETENVFGCSMIKKGRSSGNSFLDFVLKSCFLDFVLKTCY